MNFVRFSEVQSRFRGKRVAIVGTGPGCQDNEPGFIDRHDVVVRINNFKLGPGQGYRCDVFYSYFGSSIRKKVSELQKLGVTLCMAKCPNDKPIVSAWHERHGHVRGIDFRYIFRNRVGWWFCDTFVPESEHFLRAFNLLGEHVPTTGFSAILDVLACEPAEVFVTGFDFFTSGIHNVDEKWIPVKQDDPIRHRPELEAAWIKANAAKYPMKFDRRMQAALSRS